MADIQWLIGGEAGYGIMTTGALMGKLFMRLGAYVFDYVEYPSLIRGGHNAYYVRASDDPIYSQKRPVDILVALNRETVDLHKDELLPGSVIMFDPSLVSVSENEFHKEIHVMPVPFVELCKKVGADRLMMNTMSVGASLALFSDEHEMLIHIIQATFGRKGEEVVKENIRTIRTGFDYVKEHYGGRFAIHLKKKEQYMLFTSGAEAIALAAIRAGVKFTAIYPMTPINGIMVMLTQQALKYNIIVKEPEDEIAGINMAIGASFAGVRSLAATSGGGFALMSEGLSLSAQTEVPLVVVEGMRPGPATGLPTWTDQGDLRFVLHAGHGEIPRIVLSPGDAEEAFSMTLDAFNIAEKYQLLVTLLSDKYLLEGRMTVPVENIKIKAENYTIDRGRLLSDDEAEKLTDYKRYLFTDDGISPRSIPGQKNGIALTGSDEHDEKGLYNEEAENRTKMMDKRFKKLELAASVINPLAVHGHPDAPLTLIGFGSTKLPVLDAMEILKREGININFLQIYLLNPFPAEAVGMGIRKARNTLILEQNRTGQLEGLIREHTGLSISNHFRKFDGRPFYPEEIIQKVKNILHVT